LYGMANGYGWKLNEVIGSQIVSVPLSVPLAHANHVFNVFIASLISIFVVIFILINILLKIFVVKPVQKITSIADVISKGGVTEDEFNVRGKDDIAKLSQSFNRMRRSLEKAMDMLK